MEYLKGKTTKAMAEFFEEDYRRIDHALAVLKHAETIFEQGEYPHADLEIVIASALLHDVGIKPSESELGYNNGKTQEEYGPPIAREILTRIGLASEKIEKVAEIIGNHHSPSLYVYPELAILKAADHIVNVATKG